jgi:hypothetical protein
MAQIRGYNAILAGDGVNLGGSCWHRHDVKTHPHIEDLVHLCIADLPTRLNQAEDRLRLRQLFDDEAHRRLNAMQIEQAIAGLALVVLFIASASSPLSVNPSARVGFSCIATLSTTLWSIQASPALTRGSSG